DLVRQTHRPREVLHRRERRGHPQDLAAQIRLALFASQLIPHPPVEVPRHGGVGGELREAFLAREHAPIHFSAKQELEVEIRRHRLRAREVVHGTPPGQDPVLAASAALARTISSSSPSSKVRRSRRKRSCSIRPITGGSPPRNARARRSALHPSTAIEIAEEGRRNPGSEPPPTSASVERTSTRQAGPHSERI